MRAHRTETEQIADRCFEEFTNLGRLKSDDLRRLFLQKRLKPADQALREEIVYLLFDMMGRRLSTVAKATGLSTQKILRLVEVRTKRLHETPEGRERELAREEKLEEKRFEARSDILDLCMKSGKAAMEQFYDQIGEMKPYEAVRAAVLSFKLAGMLTETAKTPDASGERLLDDETLEAKAREYLERRQKLALVPKAGDGSDQATA